MRSRLNITLINTVIGIASQIVLAILNLVLRRVFVNTIGLDYLGLNGLFGNVLSLLALTESGVGIALSYSLYQPIKDNDTKQIAVLLAFFKRLYTGIALIVLCLGIGVSFFMGYLVNDSSFSIPTLTFYFYMFLIQNIGTYFWAYKISYLNANQQNYIVSLIQMLIQCLVLILKIFCLYVFGSFVAYLVLNISYSILSNLCIAIYVDRKHPELLGYQDCKIGPNEKKMIWKNIKGLFFHKVGAFVVFGTDNIIISTFINLRSVGIYSNYAYVLTLFNTFASQLFNAIIPSMGNYIADKDENDIYNMYKNIQLLCFCIFGGGTTILLNAMQPFIQLWLGNDCMMTHSCLLLFLLNFYLNGMRNPIQIIKNSGGQFYDDRISPIIESTVNIVASVVLTKMIGLSGVFLGTILSGLAAPFWISPKIVFKNVFHKQVTTYFVDMGKFLGILLLACASSMYLSQIVMSDVLLLRFLTNILMSSFIFMLLLVVFFRKTSEFDYFKTVAIKFLKIFGGTGKKWIKRD